MRKPSIFSRDYEKKIKKRKRIMVTIFILVLLLVGVLVVKFTKKAFDFTDVRAKIQRWIDGDTSNDNIIGENPEVEEPQETPEEPIVIEEKIMDIKVNEEKIIKIEYEEVDGKVKFKEVKEVPEGIEYDISPSKELIVVIDDKQNMKVINSNGEEKNITKESYIAPNGEVFKKDIVQNTYKDYLWHNSPKFINDNNIVYKTNMPYFGYNLNEYLWIIDINGKNEITLWKSKGKNISIGEIKEKGIEITIDGNVKYINNENNLVN